MEYKYETIWGSTYIHVDDIPLILQSGIKMPLKKHTTKKPAKAKKKKSY